MDYSPLPNMSKHDRGPSLTHHSTCREAGKKLFMDAKRMEEPTGGWGEGATAGVEAIFGSFTDPAFVSTDPPVGPLGRLAGRVTHAWAGAVLHVLSKADVEAFARHALAMLAPGGVWFGVRPPLPACPCMPIQ